MKYQPPYGVSDPDAPYINGDPSIARQGSILPAGAAEFPQREIVHFIEKNNVSPTDDDLFQLVRAGRSGWMNWVIDTGSTNNMSVALDPPLTMYRQGLVLRVLVKNNNTGPTSINVNGLGSRAVTRSNSAQLEADDIRVGMIALLVDDGTKFQVVNYQGSLATAPVNNYYIHIPYVQDTGVQNSVIGVYVPAITSVATGDLVLVRIAYKNSAAVMFTVNGRAPEPIKRNDGQPLQQFDLEKNEIVLLVYNVNFWQVMRLVRSQVQFKLSANLILYVRPDGDDVNGDGAENTPQSAFRTIQRAINYIKGSFSIAGRQVTVQLGIPGTYVGQVNVNALPGSVVIRGDPNNVASYVVQGPSGNTGYNYVFMCTGSGTDVLLQGILFVLGDAYAHYLNCWYSASMTVDNCSFTGAGSYQACIACLNANVIILNDIHVYQHCAEFVLATEGGTIISGAWYTNVFVHQANFSQAFAWANSNAQISLYYGYINFTGSGTGYRYFSTNGSVILTGSGGLEFFPGSYDGITDESSVYT